MNRIRYIVGMVFFMIPLRLPGSMVLDGEPVPAVNPRDSQHQVVVWTDYPPSSVS